jgi:hypothetical protein
MSMELQKEFCEKNKLPFFAPGSGRCFVCGKEIVDDGGELITGCCHCNYSFCD